MNSPLGLALSYLVGVAVGQGIIALYYLVYRPWKLRRIEARWQAEYQRRVARYGHVDNYNMRMLGTR